MTEARAEILLALQFLTRLPVGRADTYTEARMHKSVRWYPLVGVIIGGILAGVLALTNLFWPPIVAALLTLLASVALTGALHEDGMADSADGFGGGLTRDKVLEIMRDSRLGTYGSLALILVLGVQAAVLATAPLALAAAALIGAHALSRLTILETVRGLSYARITETKGFVLPGISSNGLRLARITAALACLPFLILAPLMAMSGLLMAFLAMRFSRRMIARRLKGYTGDALGMTQQLVFTAFLLSAAVQ